MIDTPDLAAQTIADGKADLILQARQALRDPYFPRHAALALGEPKAVVLPPQYGRA
jgi:2,4-dienoyl-CoA reductase-like NADH-dependent reductase (Old Yellow Enzyme family)